VSTTETLRRSSTDVKLAGLCAALARRWNVDPVLVRVGWALLALSGGVRLVLYLAGWLLIPVEGSDKAPLEDVAGDVVQRWPRELWVTLVVVACIAVFAAFSALLPFSVGPAIVIAVIWYFGFYKPRSNGRSAPPPPAAVAGPPAYPVPQFVRYPGPPTPFTEAAEAWQRRIAEHARQTAEARPNRPVSGGEWPIPPFAPLRPEAYTALATPPPPPERDPEELAHEAYLATPDPVGLYSEPDTTAAAPLVRSADRRSARRLRLVTLLVLGLVLSGLGIADYLGQSIPVVVYAAAALLVVGLALVAATWFGRARGILPVGVLLLVGVLGLSMSSPTETGLPTPTHPGSVVNRTYTTGSQLPPGGDAVDVGQLTVDLSQLGLSSDTTYVARVDAGELDVIVPDNVKVVVDYKVDFGTVNAYGRQVGSGYDLSGVVADPVNKPAGTPTLTLEIVMTIGEATVRR
jgi:phage shock protein PspC (stress-responsive transcriptional regulator)